MKAYGNSDIINICTDDCTDNFQKASLFIKINVFTLTTKWVCIPDMKHITSRQHSCRSYILHQSSRPTDILAARSINHGLSTLHRVPGGPVLKMSHEID